MTTPASELTKAFYAVLPLAQAYAADIQTPEYKKEITKQIASAIATADAAMRKLKDET